jgi:hypothetical protein
MFLQGWTRVFGGRAGVGALGVRIICEQRMLKCFCVRGRVNKVEPVAAVKDSSSFAVTKLKRLWSDSSKVSFHVERATPAIVMMRKAVMSRRCHDLAKALVLSGRLDDSTNNALSGWPCCFSGTETLKEVLEKLEAHLANYTLVDETARCNWEKLHAVHPQACRLNWGGKITEPVVAVGVRDNVNMSVMKNGCGLVDKWMELVSVRCLL